MTRGWLLRSKECHALTVGDAPKVFLSGLDDLVQGEFDRARTKLGRRVAGEVSPISSLGKGGALSCDSIRLIRNAPEIYPRRENAGGT